MLSFNRESHPRSHPLLMTAATWRAVLFPSLLNLYDIKLKFNSAPQSEMTKPSKPSRPRSCFLTKRIDGCGSASSDETSLGGHQTANASMRKRINLELDSNDERIDTINRMNKLGMRQRRSAPLLISILITRTKINAKNCR